MIGMAGYTKLFNSILASSVWQESLSTKVLWITLLAMADKDGIAEASLPGLAKIAGLSIAETEAGIKSLTSPDKYSRTKDFDGRRIEEIDGGWKVLNHPKYRAKMSVDERREYKRLKQQEYRAAAKSTKSTGGQSGHNAKAYTEAKAEASNGRGVARTRESIHDACNRLTEGNPDIQAIDRLDEDIAFEESRFNSLALSIGRDRIQSVLDSLPRPKSVGAFSASRWLSTGRNGIGRSESAMIRLRLTCDALEAWKRKVESPSGRKKGPAPAWDRGIAHDVPDEVILAWDPRLGPKPDSLREPAQTQTQEMPS